MTDPTPTPRGASSLPPEVTESVVELIGAASTWFHQRELDLKREARWRFVRRIALVLLVGFSLGTYWKVYGPLMGVTAGGPSRDSIVIVEVSGPIGGDARATADRLVPLIRTACDAPATKALVLRINSPGGSPTEAERIASAVADCRAEHPTLPIVAAVEGMGASAAYLIASSTDRVLASRYSLVGSIGAVMRSLDASVGLERLGMRERTYASGPLKAGGSMASPNTPEQDALYQQVINQVGQAFADQVRANRSGRLLQDTQDLFSGRVWVAEEALAIGLVDEVILLDDWLRREHRDVPQHVLRPTKTLQDQMTLESLVSSVTGELLSRNASLQVE